MISPGHPGTRRSIERQFWQKIATGVSSEDAAAAVGVSQAIGGRGFRQGGGMPTIALTSTGGRYLSFAEREEIALLRAQNLGVRAIAGRLGRDASTVSRELRRNVATRGGKLQYRASVAQWKAELMARRPKTAKRRSDVEGTEQAPPRGSGVVDCLESGADLATAQGRFP